MIGLPASRAPGARLALAIASSLQAARVIHAGTGLRSECRRPGVPPHMGMSEGTTTPAANGRSGTLQASPLGPQWRTSRTATSLTTAKRFKQGIL